MNKMIRQLNHDIIKALAVRSGALPRRKAVLERMKAPAWTDGLAALFPIQARLSCGQVLELCAPILDQICPEPPEKGWGPFCYQYNCDLRFPNCGFAPEADRCG